jgi:hypothetical protein
MNRCFPFLFLLSCLPLCLHGQNASGSLNQNRSFYAGFAAVAYKGSLQSTYLRWTPSYHAGMLIEGKKLLSSSVGIGLGSYIAEDRNYRLPAKADPSLQPLAAIEGNFFTLSYELRFLLFRYHGLRIQFCQGLGLFRFSVKDREGNQLSEKPRSRAAGETYSQNSFFFPSSLFLQYQFSNQMALGIQAGWYNNSSAYLDNMKQLAQNETRDNLASVRFLLSIPLKSR